MLIMNKHLIVLFQDTESSKDVDYIWKITLWVRSSLRSRNGIKKNAMPDSRKQTPKRMMGILNNGGKAANGVWTTRLQRPKTWMEKKRR